MREREVEAYLTERVQRAGGMSIKLAPTTAGLPDRLLVLPAGRVVFVEVKRPGGLLRPVQKVIAKRLSDRGAEVRVVDSKGAVDRLIEEISG